MIFFFTFSFYFLYFHVTFQQTLPKIQYQKNRFFTNSLPEKQPLHKIHYQKNVLITKFNFRKTGSSQNSTHRHESFYYFLGIPLFKGKKEKQVFQIANFANFLRNNNTSCMKVTHFLTISAPVKVHILTINHKFRQKLAK